MRRQNHKVCSCRVTTIWTKDLKNIFLFCMDMKQFQDFAHMHKSINTWAWSTVIPSNPNKGANLWCWIIFTRTTFLQNVSSDGWSAWVPCRSYSWIQTLWKKQLQPALHMSSNQITTQEWLSRNYPSHKSNEQIHRRHTEKRPRCDQTVAVIRATLCYCCRSPAELPHQLTGQ